MAEHRSVTSVDGDRSRLDGDRSRLLRPREGSEPPAEVALVWEGDLDIVSSPVLSRVFAVLHRSQVGSVSLDASAVTFLDCSGLGVLVAADARLSGRLQLLDPSARVVRLLDLVAMGDHFGSRPGEPRPAPTNPAVTLERAKGLVMATFRCTPGDAVALLRAEAEMRHIRVDVLAALLVTVVSAESASATSDARRAVEHVVGRSPAPVVPQGRRRSRGWA